MENAVSLLSKFSTHFRRKAYAPGHRPTASRIIARAALLSTGAVFVLECGGAAVALCAGYMNAALSFLCASALIAGINLLSWGEMEAVPRFMPRLQGVGFFLGFTLKSFLVLATFYSLSEARWIDMPMLVLAFIGGVILDLLVSSIVVLHNQIRD